MPAYIKYYRNAIMVIVTILLFFYSHGCSFFYQRKVSRSGGYNVMLGKCCLRNSAAFRCEVCCCQ